MSNDSAPQALLACQAGLGPAAVSPIAAGSAHLDSRSLFGGRSELVINHGGEEYRLRLTRQGKLILTK
jgi:hemin uptake protein HemP